jgi:hypothetical protein
MSPIQRLRNFRSLEIFRPFWFPVQTHPGQTNRHCGELSDGIKRLRHPDVGDLELTTRASSSADHEPGTSVTFQEGGALGIKERLFRGRSETELL